MILTTMARLGRDAEMKHTSSGTPVLQLALACDYGRKGDDGRKPTQWIDAALFGKRAETLAQYLTKGTMMNVALREPHIETYAKKDGTQGVSLRAEVIDVLWFSSPRADAAPVAPAPSRVAANKPARAAPQPGASEGFRDDDIPFAPISKRKLMAC